MFGGRPEDEPHPVRTRSCARPARDVDHLARDEARALADEEAHGVRDVLELARAGHRDLGGAGGDVGAPSPARCARRSPWSCPTDDEPGRDAVRGDAELAQLDREGLGEALQARLGRGVVGLAAVAQRRRAGEVDDAAPPGVHHVLLHGPRHEERAAQVHAHDGVPVVVAHLEQQVVAGDAGVVDQHGGRAELGGHPLDGGRDLLGVRHVGADGERADPRPPRPRRRRPRGRPRRGPARATASPSAASRWAVAAPIPRAPR